jgi:hypothetical protein
MKGDGRIAAFRCTSLRMPNNDLSDKATTRPCGLMHSALLASGPSLIQCNPVVFRRPIGKLRCESWVRARSSAHFQNM